MGPQREIPHEIPSIALSGAKLDELELLAGGLYSPADGYCLPQDVPKDWPAPFFLEVPKSLAATALRYGAIAVTDPDGTPLYYVETTATATAAGGLAHIAGRVATLRLAEHPPARHLRITSPLPASSPGRGTHAAIFTSVPRAAELAQAMTESARAGNRLLLVAACGHQPHGNYTVMPLLDELRKISEQIPCSAVGLLVLPSLGGGTELPGDALYRHALKRLGASTVLDFHAQPSQTPAPLAGDKDHGGADLSGTVIFLTGLSGSGKSTVARALVQSLQPKSSRPVTLLDGDDVRRMLSPGLGFSPEEREANIRRLGWVASLIAQAGGVVVCAPIAPYDKTRKEVRAMIEAVGRFVLIHVSTPLEVCEARDRKGLYARARSGQLTNFTGIDAPYEIPGDADLHIDTSVMPVAASLMGVHDYLGCNDGAGEPALTPMPVSP